MINVKVTSVKERYPQSFRITGVLRAPEQATAKDVRQVFELYLRSFTIKSIELIEEGVTENHE